MIKFDFQKVGIRTGVPSVFVWDEDISDPFAFANKLTETVPDEDWTGIDLVITDYELSEESQKQYIEIFNILAREGIQYVTIETNGQTKLQEEFDNYLQRFTGQLVFACKTEYEYPQEEHMDAIIQYCDVANSSVFLHITTGKNYNEETTKEIVDLYQSEGVDVPIYITASSSEEEQEVRSAVLRSRLRYSPI